MRASWTRYVRIRNKKMVFIKKCFRKKYKEVGIVRPEVTVVCLAKNSRRLGDIKKYYLLITRKILKLNKIEFCVFKFCKIDNILFRI